MDQDSGPVASEPLASPRRSGGGREVGVVVAAAVALVAVAVGAFALSRQEPREARVVASAVTECDPVRDFEVTKVGQEHRTGTIDYRAAPPYAGVHHPSPLPATPRLVPRDDPRDHIAERAVHNLEHGYVVVWYDGSASDEEIEAVEEAALDSGERKVIVVPWERSDLPNSTFVLAAWGHLQSCDKPDSATLRAFYDAYGGTNGQAPEGVAP